MWWLSHSDIYDDVHDVHDDDSHYPKAVGFAVAIVAIVFFGSNYVPIKRLESGDGMFFQWIMCSAIWWCGMALNLIRNCPTFYPVAMLGGFIWATGNILTIPILRTVGLGQGILIWASVNLMVGWLCGRFGWVDLEPKIPNHPAMNYAGIALCLVSAIVFFFIKSESSEPESIVTTVREGDDDDDDDPLLPPQPVQQERVTIHPPQTTCLDRMSPVRKRIFGTIAAVVAGALYGVNFQPVFYVMTNYDIVNPNVLDFVFAHFCGIYLTSSVYFLIYCAYMTSRPNIYPRLILPGFISGIMWAIADVGWFIANQTLSEVVSFPLITTTPGIIGALWGIFLFKEIRGRRNYLLLILAVSFGVTGAILTSFSIV